jgi:hypothetical protein
LNRRTLAKSLSRWARYRGNLEGLIAHLQGIPRSAAEIAMEKPILGALRELLAQARIMGGSSKTQREVLCPPGFEQQFEDSYQLLYEAAVRDCFWLLEYFDDPFTV